ncbi:type II toxin-antitoxin system TacA family antitoxin [Comamonas badia]|uniref:type II toxin-antitoxin system TacA family antitoxin n=1 Tax=Comamonas badia TaxID=265291 RepID=UPI000463D749|nr:DUF1778 domain-containing protein [Comamonas badia]
MPRVAVDENQRMSLRLLPEQKALLRRAAALRNTDLTDFVLQPALREASAVIEAASRVVLSERDSLRMLDLLENPPPPNARLLAAARNLPPLP